MGQEKFKLNVASFQRHSNLSWSYPITSGNGCHLQISNDGINYALLKITDKQAYMHFTDGAVLDHYFITASVKNSQGSTLAISDTIEITEEVMSDEALLDMVQSHTFQYFYEFAHPISGMARERDTSGDIVTTGGTGFGIMALLSAIENGYITREQGLNQLIKIVSFLQFADRFHGVFPHWLNGTTGNVYPFSQFDDGGDLVETAFLMEGLLTARSFFDQDNASEKAVRKIITKLWEDVEWDWYSRNDSGVLYWHWSPKNEWKLNFQIRGYNEALIIYLLAISSPTHPVKPSYWKTGWTAGAYKNGNNYYNIKLPVGFPYGGPLFFAHYSFMGFDPRYYKDDFTNYFTQNRNHTLINRAYCIANPLKFKEYSAQCWGLTASDDPNGYLAHEPVAGRDNGTISPTAALSSMPYTPAESMEALKYFYLVKGDKTWGRYGFYDAFNPTKNWYATSYLAIDQGPIVAMIQNYRTQLLWNNFMKNAEIPIGLTKIGFKPDTSSDEDLLNEDNALLYPNPTANNFYITCDKPLELIIYNKHGMVINQIKNYIGAAIDLDGPAGIYYVQTIDASHSKTYKVVKL